MINFLFNSLAGIFSKRINVLRLKYCVLCILKAAISGALIFVLSSGALAPEVQAQESNSAMSGLSIGMGALSAGISGVVAVILFKQCSKDKMSCAMGAMAAGNAITSLGTTVQQMTTKNAFSNGATPNSFDNLTPDLKNELDNLGINNDKDLTNAMNDIIKNAEKNGVKLNKDGSVTTKKGTVPAGAFASSASLAETGMFTAEELATFDKNKKMIENKFKTAGINPGAGGAGGGTSTAYKYSYEGGEGNYRYGGGSGNAPRTEGLTRTLASGDRIGSSTDNIFEMVHRNYRLKSEEKIFVGQQD
jgi:hypothetical protein